MAPDSILAIPVPANLVEVVAQRAAEILAAEAPDPLAYLTVQEAANYLRCKPKRVYDLCSQRRVNYLKDGSRTLLRRVDLDAYLEGQL
jgi:excisionase family DNA binding protein